MIKQEMNVNGTKLKLIARTGLVCVYEQSFGGRSRDYEVQVLSFGLHIVPFKDKSVWGYRYPSNSKWGVTGFTYTSKADAMKAMFNLAEETEK